MNERVWARESPVLADTSAWTNAVRAGGELNEGFSTAIGEGEVVCCLPVRQELLFAAPVREAIDEVEAALNRLPEIHLSRPVQLAAIATMRELAERGPAGGHRIPLADLLIAAAAQSRGIPVLHYDRHFDRLAEAMGFTSLWIAPPSSI